MSDIQYYEVPLYIMEETHVCAPNELGEGWAMDTDLIHEAANGYPVHEITEDQLPAPLNNDSYSHLRLFKQDGPFGANYFGIAEKMAGGF